MSWGEILGQERAIQQIRASLDAGRMPHAMVFRGPLGVGKRRTAIALVQALFCREGGGREGCGKCRTCRRILEDGHPDCIVLARPTGRQRIPIGGDETEEGSVRWALAALAWKPFEAPRRVLLVDEAEWLSPEASVALLKTVEEPPPRSHVLLITSRPRGLPATLRSRCQCVRFARLAESDVRSVLDRLDTGRLPLEPALALAQGSPGRALRLARGEGAFPAERLARLTSMAPLALLDRSLLEGGKGKAPTLAAAKRNRVRAVLRLAAERLREDPRPQAREGLGDLLFHLEAVERNAQADLVLDAARRTLAWRLRRRR